MSKDGCTGGGGYNECSCKSKKYNEQEVMSMMRMAAELTDAEINKYRDSYLALIKEKDGYIKELEGQLESTKGQLTALEAVWNKFRDAFPVSPYGEVMANQDELYGFLKKVDKMLEGEKK